MTQSRARAKLNMARSTGQNIVYLAETATVNAGDHPRFAIFLEDHFGRVHNPRVVFESYISARLLALLTDSYWINMALRKGRRIRSTRFLHILDLLSIKKACLNSAYHYLLEIMIIMCETIRFFVGVFGGYDLFFEKFRGCENFREKIGEGFRNFKVVRVCD